MAAVAAVGSPIPARVPHPVWSESEKADDQNCVGMHKVGMKETYFVQGEERI